MPPGGGGYYYFHTNLVTDDAEVSVFDIRVNGEQTCTGAGGDSSDSLEYHTAACSIVVQVQEGKSLTILKQECIPVGYIPPALYNTGGIVKGWLNRLNFKGKTNQLKKNFIFTILANFVYFSCISDRNLIILLKLLQKLPCA